MTQPSQHDFRWTQKTNGTWAEKSHRKKPDKPEIAKETQNKKKNKVKAKNETKNKWEYEKLAMESDRQPDTPPNRHGMKWA